MLYRQNQNANEDSLPLRTVPAASMPIFTSSNANAIPPAATSFPIVEDQVLVAAIRQRAMASMLIQAGNPLYTERLLQAAALLDGALPYQALLGPHYFSDASMVSNNAGLHPASNPTVSPVLSQKGNSLGTSLRTDKTKGHKPSNAKVTIEPTTSDSSVLKRKPNITLAPVRPSQADIGRPVKQGTRKRSNGGKDDPQISEKTLDAVNGATSKANPPKKRRKLPKEGVPRRPLTAYNLFFRDERAKILAEIETAAENGAEATEAIIKEPQSQLSTEEFLKQRVPGSKRKRQRPHGKIGF